ncbi:MAG: zinc ribbon domain-containing protein [Melioribacteraceae bacterium]|nr:zinc ribbon domain-containing protein [Melioribacteraceae bacterium]
MGIFDKQQKQPLIASYKMRGKKIVCPYCGSDKFEVRDVLLNTTAMTFLGFDWANKTASAMICTNCSRIEWYFNQPEFSND